MEIKTLVEFSGIPKGTTGQAERDGKIWKITWNLEQRTKPLCDWFNQEEFDKYLVVT